jgi:hypothetical protein
VPAARYECVDQMLTDETAAAGDQDRSGVTRAHNFLFVRRGWRNADAA